MNSSKLERPSEHAMRYSKLANLSDVREVYDYPKTSRNHGPRMLYAIPSAEAVPERSCIEDTYESKVAEVQSEQVERMVQKALRRTKN